jgi:general secretion pathway protein F
VPSRPRQHAISLEQLVLLNDEIVSLVRSGIPLELGLKGLGSDLPGALGEITTSLGVRLESGMSLPEALSAEEHRIPLAYRTVVEAGLRTGRLSAALESISNFGRDLIDLRQRIGLALLYPLIIIVLAYGLFMVFLVDVVDRFRETYEAFRLPMNVPLRVAIFAQQLAGDWWWVPPALLAGLMLWWVATGGAQALNFHGAAQPLAWIPGIRGITRSYHYANFAELLALLLDHQVPLPDGIRLAADSAADERLRYAAHELARAAERGETSQAGVGLALPSLLRWLLLLGTQQGKLSRALRHAAGIYRRRAVRLIDWFKLWFPLASAVVIGGGVTMIYALTVFGPLAWFLKDLSMD